MVGEEHECIVGGKFVVTEALSRGVLKVVLMFYISFVFLNTVIVCVCLCGNQSNSNNVRLQTLVTITAVPL